MHENCIKTSNAPARVAELDGLRGIAILLVISFHYINNQLTHPDNVLGKWVAHFTSFGWVGVDLFFVISGFLIGSVLMKNKGSRSYFSTFYMRRLVRIIPNYCLVIVAFLVLCSIPYFSNDYFLTGNNVLPWWSYCTMVHNLLMANMQNMGNNAMSVTWSIGIEEQFYLIFPFVVYFVKDKWLPWILGFAVLAAPLMRVQFNNWIPTYVLLPCRMDALALGALVAYYSHHTDLKSFVNRYFFNLLAIMLIDVAVCAVFYTIYNDLGPIKHTLFALFFAIGLLITLSPKASLYNYMLRNKFLVYIGKISYSLYLFHYMILGIFQRFIGNNNIVIHNGREIFISLIALGISVAFSSFIYKRLESPMVNWGKQFKY